MHFAITGDPKKNKRLHRPNPERQYVVLQVCLHIVLCVLFVHGFGYGVTYVISPCVWYIDLPMWPFYLHSRSLFANEQRNGWQSKRARRQRNANASADASADVDVNADADSARRPSQQSSQKSSPHSRERTVAKRAQRPHTTRETKQEADVSTRLSEIDNTSARQSANESAERSRGQNEKENEDHRQGQAVGYLALGICLYCGE